MSSSPYLVVALDLDGTTVRSDGTVSPRTAAALRRVESFGVTVIAVTGRPPRWMDNVLHALGPSGLAICCNGAVVIDIADGSVVSSRLLSVVSLGQLIAVLGAGIPGCGFAVERSDSFVHDGVYKSRFTDPGIRAAISDDELLAVPARKLLVRKDSLGPDELLAAASALITPDVATLTHSSNDGLLEISAVGVSKATTLSSVCDSRGVAASQVIAFGDMPNDIPMITWAGHGVAVANAHPSLLAIADEVTVSNDDDGVAVVLERLWATFAA